VALNRSALRENSPVLGVLGFITSRQTAEHVAAERVKTQKRRRSPPRNRPRGEDAARRERTAKALDLRIAGASYRQIARQLDIADATAYADIQEELGRLDALNGQKAERLRDLEARRLDQLTIALQPGIESGDPRAILAAVRIMERRARLFGLDAPQKVTGPEGEPVAIRIVHQQLGE
jgi:hypothetical protein